MYMAVYDPAIFMVRSPPGKCPSSQSVSTLHRIHCKSVNTGFTLMQATGF